MKSLIEKLKSVNILRLIRDTYFWQRMSVFLVWTLVFYLVFWRFVSATNPLFMFWVLGMLALFLWAAFGVFRRPKAHFEDKKPMKSIWKRSIAFILGISLAFPLTVLVGSSAALAVKPYSSLEIAQQKAEAKAEAKAELVRLAAEKAQKEAEAKAAADKAAADKAAQEERTRQEMLRKKAEEKEAAAKAAKEAAERAAQEEQAKLDAEKAEAARVAEQKQKDAQNATNNAKAKREAEAAKVAEQKLKDRQASIDNAKAKKEAEKKRLRELKSSKPLVFAVESCGAAVFGGTGIEDYAQASQEGSTMFLTTGSGDDFIGLMVLNCVADALSFSAPLRASINRTNALMGTKTWTENKREYEWSFHPAVGLNMSVIRQKDCFLGFCN